jgi:hypothetical protein
MHDGSNIKNTLFEIFDLEKNMKYKLAINKLNNFNNNID